MRFSDLMLGGVLLVFAAALAGFATTFPSIPGQRYGAETFPFLVAAGFAACGLSLIIRGRRQARAAQAASGGTEPREPLVSRTEWTRKPGAILAVFITVGLVAAYILLARHIGFMPLMATLLLVLFRLLQVPWLQSVVIAVLGTLLLDFVFRSVLLVPLPFGIVPYLPW